MKTPLCSLCSMNTGLGPVVQKLISVNQGLNFNLGFYTSLFDSLSRIIFSSLHGASNHQIIKLLTKRIILNFPLKLPELKSNFTLTLVYLNPALNNPALNTNSECMFFS